MILLLDESQALEKKDYEKLLNYYNSGFFRSIVFVSQEYNEDEIPPNLAKTIKLIKSGWMQ